jgi:hypothetical protein
VAAHETIFEVFLSVQFNFAYHLNYQSQDKKGKFEERSNGFAGRSNKAKRLSCFFLRYKWCVTTSMFTGVK